jgi:hypothetical protein
LRPYAEWVDAYIKPRFNWLIQGALQRRIVAVLMCLLALTMFPLALVPFGVQPPATAIVLFGVALLGRDGLFAAVGYAFVALTIWIVWTYRETLAAPWMDASSSCRAVPGVMDRRWGGSWNNPAEQLANDHC